MTQKITHNMTQTAIGTFIAPLQLATASGEISARRLQLLQAIAASGTISAAAKQIGITYKAAWDAVEAMNNLAGQVLVSAQQGGRGGGGAVLTVAGQQVLTDFALLEQLQQQFLQQIQQQPQLQQAAELLKRLTMKTSARNALYGTVTAIKDGAVNSEVTLALPGGDQLCAVITRDSVSQLGLTVGKGAYALIKASWIILGEADSTIRTSARNRLAGVVTRISPGAVNAEVILELAGGATLAAIITNDSLHQLALQPEQPVLALVKASHIILGVTD